MLGQLCVLGNGDDQNEIMHFLTTVRRILASMGAFAMLPICFAQPNAFLSHPDIHGDRIVFTAEGDLWIAELKSGDAWRLTSDRGVETNAHFSPDGSQLAYTAQYDGGRDVYMMPIDGGIPRRLTFFSGGDDSFADGVQGWTPDGKNIVFNSGAKLSAPKWEQVMTQQLFTVSSTGGLPKLVAVPRATYASWSPDGKSVVYVPSSSEWMNWFRYEGGEADQVWLADITKGTFSRLTDSKSVDTEPIWFGSEVYFVSERSGTRNLWRLDPATKRAVQVTFFKDDQVRFPSTDGNRIIFQLGTGLGLYDPKTGASRPVTINLHSDRVHARPFQALVKPNMDDVSTGAGMSPDGERIVLSPRGHLVTVPVKEGEVHQLVDDSSQRVKYPAWSPDGKQIAYLSDSSGEEQLYEIEDHNGSKARQITRGLTGEHGPPVWSPDGKFLLIGDRSGHIQLVDVATGKETEVAHDKGPWSGGYIEADFSFSPDSRWIAYAVSAGWRFTTVYLYEVATGKSVRVSNPNIGSSAPVFSADGKYLFMIQDRSISQSWTGISGRMSQTYAGLVTGVCLSKETPNPMVGTSKKGDDAPPSIDFDGLESRTFDLHMPPGPYWALFTAKNRLLVQGDNVVLSCEISTGKTSRLAGSSTILDLSRNREKLLVQSGSSYRVLDAGAESAPDGAGTVDLQGLTVTVEPEKEWRQMLRETWRVWRDLFYDPKMHGIDWKAMWTKYEPRLSMVGSRYDLTRLIRDMISELNTGHSFAGSFPDYVGKESRPASLGADLTWDETVHAYQISHIYRGSAWNPDARSPLSPLGSDIREGDYLLKIAGKDLSGDLDPAALLLGMAGRSVELVVNRRPTLEGAKTLVVKPIASDRDLRLSDWIESRRAYVEKASGGQLSYVYLGDMSDPGATQYAQQYYPNVDKPGIIFDIRGNDGGNISGNILSDLSAHPMAFFAYRTGTNYRRESWAPLGKMALVTNQWAFSDADYFTECFKRFKIGPVIGHRTTGGTVGPVGYRLVDGGGISVPNYGAWIGNEWIVEGKGAVPDYEIDEDPASVMAGRDPQLDKAISVLMSELKAHPFQMPVHPPYPIKTGGSRG
ncbi:MAG: hypothetical protein GC165_14195 [Armatimonadetes bacterium]|nr:hypothetical protein [Armatimonadota bacterium]